MTEYLKKYVEYLKNVGGPIGRGSFDDDWEPIGPMVRADMLKAGLIVESDDGTIELEKEAKQD